MTGAISTIDEFESEYKKGIGVEINLDGQRFLREVTRDNIMNFADAVGDNNPLWINEEYARKSPLGMLTAPPTFLFNINHGTLPAHTGTIAAPISLIQLYSGAEIEVFRTLRCGDSISVKGRSLDITRKESKSVGGLLFMIGEASYFNQRKELVGIIRTTICRYKAPNKQAIEFDRQPVTGTEFKSPDELAFERIRRGSEPRFWEDVVIGEDMLPVLEKGVLTMSEISRFGFMVSPMPRRIEAKKLATELGFERETMQKRAGLENASDYGPQRICWLVQMVTDWMGDYGTLKKVTGQVRHPNIIGDVSCIKGKVLKKYTRGTEYLVDCQIWAENQSGLVTAPGQATVALPSKKSIFH